MDLLAVEAVFPVEARTSLPVSRPVPSGGLVWEKRRAWAQLWRCVIKGSLGLYCAAEENEKDGPGPKPALAVPLPRGTVCLAGRRRRAGL